MTFLLWLQIALSILLSLAILVQTRSAGLGSLAGGSDSGSFHAERRGAEKLLFRTTVILAIAFCLNAFLLPFFS